MSPPLFGDKTELKNRTTTTPTYRKKLNETNEHDMVVEDKVQGSVEMTLFGASVKRNKTAELLNSGMHFEMLAARGEVVYENCSPIQDL